MWVTWQWGKNGSNLKNVNITSLPIPLYFMYLEIHNIRHDWAVVPIFHFYNSLISKAACSLYAYNRLYVTNRPAQK